MATAQHRNHNKRGLKACLLVLPKDGHTAAIGTKAYCIVVAIVVHVLLLSNLAIILHIPDKEHSQHQPVTSWACKSVITVPRIAIRKRPDVWTLAVHEHSLMEGLNFIKLP